MLCETGPALSKIVYQGLHGERSDRFFSHRSLMVKCDFCDTSHLFGCCGRLAKNIPGE